MAIVTNIPAVPVVLYAFLFRCFGMCLDSRWTLCKTNSLHMCLTVQRCIACFYLLPRNRTNLFNWKFFMKHWGLDQRFFCILYTVYCILYIIFYSILFYSILFYSILFYPITLNYITSHYIILYYIISYHIILYYIILYSIIYFFQSYIIS